jgi:DNA-binding PadR family transcriptional regulator
MSDYFLIIEEMPHKRNLGDLELMILLALIRLEPEAYGVPIASEIEMKCKRFVALGSVYAALDRLERAGLAKSELGEATAERGGKAKRYFRTTAKGLREVRITRESLVSMWKDLPQLEGGIA